MIAGLTVSVSTKQQQLGMMTAYDVDASDLAVKGCLG